MTLRHFGLSGRHTAKATPATLTMAGRSAKPSLVGQEKGATVGATSSVGRRKLGSDISKTKRPDKA